MNLAGGLWAFGLGACMGSFANTCIDRLPKGLSPIRPRSTCETCGKRLRFLHLIPIFGYIFLGGKCAFCGSPISWRLPFVEFISGVLITAAYGSFGLSWSFLLNSILLTAALIVGFIDFRHKIIPDAITLPGLGLGLVLSLLPGWPSPIESILGVAVGGGILGIVAVAYPAGMGGGDVKFMAMAGAFLGWLGAMIALFVASLAGAVVGIVLLAMGRIGRRDPIVFGPFLSLGIVVAIFLGPAILQNKLIWPIFIQAG